ncbi:Hpt domain-containing protein [Ideonella sp. B7]|uniref:Hpt domain-containing protein n=1 Tax=Ideonella benzenivorans TaxID=2831643 RepID=UPI001CED7075|nr:Hpt domain-containing protein [Ideonella benzenivorans]MCA6217945.1 Hpt domain-containing protein [Ideonella benzenivorans]
MFDANRDPGADANGDGARSEPVLDNASLDQLRALDPHGGSFLKRVLQTYQRSLTQQQQGIDQAFGAGEWQALSHAAHALKSASASVGALQLSSLCARMEQGVREARLDDMGSLVEQFRAEAVRVHAAVAELLDGGGLP